jgi:hypothetical protein
MPAKKQKIRYEIAKATRENVLGVARTARLNQIKARYRLSLGVGGLRALGCFYSGGDYWT